MKTTSLWATGIVLALLLTGCSRTEEIARLTSEASQAASRGDHAMAIGRWSAVLDLAPKNGDALLQRAALYETTGNWEKAIADYSAYLRLPTNQPSLRRTLPIPVRQPEPYSEFGSERASWFYRRGLLYAKQQNFEKACADVNEAIRLNPDEPVNYLGLAHVYELKGEPEQALPAFTKAIKVAPKAAAGYSGRGYFYARRGKFAEALADLDEAIRLDPYDADSRLRRGLAYGRRGEIDKALEDLDEAVRLSPNEPTPYVARGALLVDEGRFQEAFEDYNHVLLLRPNDPFALARRGLALTKKGEFEFALADLNAAIGLNPSEASFYASRGSLFTATNEFIGALRDFNIAIQINAVEPAFYAARGYVYSKMERYPDAVADFQEGLRLSPGSPDANNNLAWLRATCPQSEFRNGKESLDFAGRACELTGYRKASFLDTLAAACAENGDFTEAICWEKLALEPLEPTDKKRAGMQERLALYEKSRPFRQTPGQ